MECDVGDMFKCQDASEISGNKLVLVRKYINIELVMTPIFSISVYLLL
jgi:hypothetical protein